MVEHATASLRIQMRFAVLWVPSILLAQAGVVSIWVGLGLFGLLVAVELAMACTAMVGRRPCMGRWSTGSGP